MKRSQAEGTKLKGWGGRRGGGRGEQGTLEEL